MDGRPTADEAWAIALKSANEAETVVWTTEISQAAAACKAILDAGDKIGARIAFRDTYNRLVDDARAKLIPVKWDVSLGTDAKGRESAISRAQIAGQIPCDNVYPALPEPSEAAKKRIAEKTKALLAQLKSCSFRKAEDNARERTEIAKKKAEIAKAVAAYQAGM
jgi:hypothetical protein